jgi:glycerol-1-phosphate dehydrogenase [NAD(P)+]
LQRHSLPRLPAEVGLTAEQFITAVCAAPGTRPGRYTILERLAMSPAEVAKRVEEYVRAIAG